MNLYNEDDENNEIVNPDLLHQDLDQNYINQFKNSKIECSGKREFERVEKLEQTKTELETQLSNYEQELNNLRKMG